MLKSKICFHLWILFFYLGSNADNTLDTYTIKCIQALGGIQKNKLSFPFSLYHLP